MELSHVVASAVASNPSSGSNDSPGGPNSLSGQHPPLNGKLTSNGLSFDSDKFEFKVSICVLDVVKALWPEILYFFATTTSTPTHALTSHAHTHTVMFLLCYAVHRP